MSNSEKTLNRLPDEAMIGGVCAGMADRFDLDVALVRAAFVGMTVFSGFGLVAYVALWYLLDPPEPADDEQPLAIDSAAVELEDAVLPDTSSPDIDLDVDPVVEQSTETRGTIP
ncbi:MAG: PspC domain-containing protein [Acidimicrobiales bacterium]